MSTVGQNALQAHRMPGYPDMYGNLAHTTERNNQGILAGVQPQYDTRIAPYQAQPETAQTWDLSHANAAQQIQSIIHEAIESADGWWFRLAPVITVAAGLETWESTRTRFTAWDPAAEATAPRLVQIEREQHAVRLERFALGLEVHHDNYLTAKGQEEFNLKMGMIEQGLIVLQKLCVLSATTQSKLYWREQERILQTHYSLADALQSQRSRFGAMSKDPLALNKYIAEMPMMLKGAVTKPEFDMCVVPEGCIAHYLYGTQGSYHTTASKRGDAAVERNLTFGMQVLRNVVPGLDVYEDKTFQLSNAETSELNGFRRRAILGQYSVLQWDDSGPETFCNGPGEPTIELVTMPRDNWTPFTMSQCLEKCKRFDDKGSIMEFTQDYLDEMLEFGKTPEDPWVIEYKGEGRTEYVPVEFIGEQDSKYRGFDFDLEVGLCGKNNLGLSQEEKDLLAELLACADALYNPPVAVTYIAAQAYVQGDSLFSTERDEWGGYAIKPDQLSKAGGVTPYGWGDIFMVMSLLSQNKSVGPAYNDVLDYTKCKNLLMKIWTTIKETFPDLVTNDPAMVPVHRKTNDDDRNAMIATFRGLLERIKHPLYHRLYNRLDPYRGPATLVARINQLNGLGVAGSPLTGFSVTDGTFTNEAEFERAFPELVTENAKKIFADMVEDTDQEKVFRNVFVDDAGDATDRTLYLFMKDLFDGLRAEYGLNARNAVDLGTLNEDIKESLEAAFVSTFNGIATLIRIALKTDDFRVIQKLNKKTIAALAEYPRDYVSKFDQEPFDLETYRSDAWWGVTGLTFDPSVYTNAFVREGNSPANPKVPSQALFALGGKPSAFNSTLIDSDKSLKLQARAKFGAQKFGDSESFKTVKLNKDTYEATDDSTYGTERVQYMGASRAMMIGGPFLRLLPLKDDGSDDEDEFNPIVEREFMSIRQHKIATHFAHDPIARLFAFAFILSRVTKKAMKALLAHNMPVPMNFLLVAPYINIDTEAILFAKGGTETASTGMNLLDINKTFDGAHKMWHVHASVHTGTKIVSPENLLIIEDAKLAGYKYGLEKTFIVEKSYATGDKHDRAGIEHGRWYAMDVPTTYTRNAAYEHEHSHPLNLFGVDPVMYPFQFATPQTIFGEHKPFPSYGAYDSYFGFSKANGDRYFSEASYRSLRESDANPGACWPTRVRCYNRKTGHFEMASQGHGQLDDIELPMRPTLDGRVSYKNMHN